MPPATILCEEIEGRLYPCGRLRPRPEPVSVAAPGSTPGFLSEEIGGVLYPYGEEEPMVQGTLHFQIVRDLSDMAGELLRDRPEMAPFCDLLVYSRPGVGQKPCAPDLLVAEGLARPKEPRKSLRLWEEPCRPLFALEVLSDWDAAESFGKRLRRYQNDMRVPEYFVCDPRSGTAELDGYRLENGHYSLVLPDADGRLWSEQLRGWFGVAEDGLLQIWTESGVALPRYADAVADAARQAQRADDARRRADDEARRRAEAEARVRELEAAIEEMRRQAR